MTSAAASLVLVGNADPVHVGAHFLKASAALGVEARLCDSRQAFEGPAWRRRAEWWARGHRPPRLREFSARVVDTVRECRPRWLLTTGLAPVDAKALETIGDLGVGRVNFLTDDPWNPAHRAPWFMEALRQYDDVCTPRRANLADLAALDGPRATYVPFAYAPDIHFPEAPASEAEHARYAADVMFAGGADLDRVPVLASLIRAGFQVALYGGYWDRHRDTAAHARGHVDPTGLRRAVASAKVCLCLVRRTNRDGHSMRTFEVPAMGGCMLAEDTEDHRALFGRDGTDVAYFRHTEDAIAKIRSLLSDAETRRRLARASHETVVTGAHTYADRLRTVLDLAAT